MSSTAQALTSLLIRERASIIRRVEGIVGNRADAEEVTQALWFRVQAVGDDPPILRKRAFLFRLASNLALDLRRSISRRDEVAGQILAMLSETDDAPGPDRITDSITVLSRVRAAAQALPEPTRTIFRLNRFEGMSQRAIAEQLAISTTTVENHVRRALDALARARDGEC
jgi:RNA polymerase sigma-70 factor (ECF subfamily)